MSRKLNDLTQSAINLAIPPVDRKALQQVIEKLNLAESLEINQFCISCTDMGLNYCDFGVWTSTGPTTDTDS